MLPFAYYLLKIAICSAVLFGYYWFALRNKVFHGYNRFYLLAIVGLSLTLPLCRINIFQEKSAPQTSIIKMLQVVTASDEYMDEVVIAMPQKPNFSLIELLPFLYLLVSVVLFVMLIQMLLSIFALWKNGKRIKIEQIHFINTDAAKGTPFSFFKYIFWNQQIDMYSPSGNRIFKHELAHIQERHSWDKMFINLVLIVFWSNPIFWLIRRELSMIHEFIADKRAVKDGDTAAFASMILAATYPQHQNFITNNFFYSPIKRRLMMLTKNKRPCVNYISRLLALPLLVVVFAAFTIKAREYGTKIIREENKITSELNLTNEANAKDDNSQSEFIKTEIEKKEEVGETTEQSIPYTTIIYNDKPITVVIDAGHGGSDPGAGSRNREVFEKDMALILAKKIKELNKNSNINIILSRETDVFNNVKEKATFANAQHADLFISIHFESAPLNTTPTPTGMNIIVAADTFPQTKKSKLLASTIIASFKNNYGLSVSDKIYQRQKGIWVLQNVNAPSVIIQAGYIINNSDLAYLQSTKGQETFANNVLQAIDKFVNSNDFITSSPKKDYEESVPMDEIVVTNGYGNTPNTSNPLNSEAKNFESNKSKYPDTLAWYTNNKQYSKKEIFEKVETQAEFPGGTEAWKKFLMKNLNSSIPVNERWASGTYKILVKFIVEKDGRLTNITTANYTNSKTAQHCIDIIKNGPKWIPAIQNKKVVASYRVQPITFIISSEVEDAKNKVTHIDPVFRIGNLTRELVKVDVFKLQKIATVTDDYEFVSCNVYFGGTGFPKAEAANLNGKDFTKLNALLEKCAIGTSIAFTNIRVKNKDGIMAIEEKVYTLY
jgi:N-acetylmuramoyl-L-alanine amidase